MKTGYFDAVLSNEGKPILATIKVYLAGTQTLATIWANPEGTTQKDNPFQTDSYGRFKFFADGDYFYDIEVSGTGITTYKLEGVSFPLLIKTDKVRAWRTSDQTGIPRGTWTKIQLNNELDPGGNFDAITNFRFTVPVSGYYAINAHVHLIYETFVANKRYSIAIIRNGSVFLAVSEICPGTIYCNPTITCCTIEKLNLGDYIELSIWHNAEQNISIMGGYQYCFMSIHLLSL